MQNQRTKSMVMCAFFAALITIGSYIKIPFPIVPLTFQPEFVMLAAIILGHKWGSASVCVFLLSGLVGLPVFTEGGGLGYVLKPTFGYLIGYILQAFATGYIASMKRPPSYKRLVIACLCGLVLLYAVGMAYCYFVCRFYLGVSLGIGKLFVTGFLTTAPKDIVLCFGAAAVSLRLQPLTNRI